MQNKNFKHKEQKKQLTYYKYKRSPRSKITDSQLLMPTTSSVLSKSRSLKKTKNANNYACEIPKGTHYGFPTAQTSMAELEDPSFINDEIDDFMERLKNTSGPTTSSRIKTVYFENTITENLNDQMEVKNEEEELGKYENQGFCRISYEHSKKLANTEAYKRYKEKKKHAQKEEENVKQQREQKQKQKYKSQQNSAINQQDQPPKKDTFEFESRQEIVEYKQASQKVVDPQQREP